MLLSSKDYYIDLINSSKANQFTQYYHYSGVGFKKAKLNQGIYRKSDNLLVGVLQWGVSAQEGIRLDRYVKEPIDKSNYLELNRFCMADSEGKNAESQAISLGIKWIKQNKPEIKLLVSYAGRKEGNYGYIYQATNWEYLGYFISNGFWFVDGKERHQITMWYYYTTRGNQSKGFKEAICDLFNDVRQTWTKQFIYVQRLDKSLTLANAVLPYPKPSNEFPICTREEIYKRNDEVFNNPTNVEHNLPIYYYEKEKHLFSRRVELKLNTNTVNPRPYVAAYDDDGELINTFKSNSAAAEEYGLAKATIANAIKSGKQTKGYFFRNYAAKSQPPNSIEFDYIAIIDGKKFCTQSDIARYCDVSRQAVSQAKQRGQIDVGGRTVEWC